MAVENGVEAKNLIKAINLCINEDFKIYEEHKVIKIIEPENGQELHIETSGLSDIACINIDKKRVKNPDGTPAKDITLPFFDPGQKGLVKKNDAILLCNRSGIVYIFLIEMKMKNSTGYLKQLQSGRLFVEYIMSVMFLYEKCAAADVQYFGMLCYGQERKTIAKGTTKHTPIFEFSDRNGVVVTDFYESSFQLKQLISAAKRYLQNQNLI